MRCFSVGGEGSEGKKRGIIRVVCARNARTRAREKWIE